MCCLKLAHVRHILCTVNISGWTWINDDAALTVEWSLSCLNRKHRTAVSSQQSADSRPQGLVLLSAHCLILISVEQAMFRLLGWLSVLTARVDWHRACIARGQVKVHVMGDNVMRYTDVHSQTDILMLIGSFYNNNNNNNNNIYLLQLSFYPVAVVILHVNKTWNRLLN